MRNLFKLLIYSLLSMFMISAGYSLPVEKQKTKNTFELSQTDQSKSVISTSTLVDAKFANTNEFRLRCNEMKIYNFKSKTFHYNTQFVKTKSDDIKLLSWHGGHDNNFVSYPKNIL